MARFGRAKAHVCQRQRAKTSRKGRELSARAAQQQTTLGTQQGCAKTGGESDSEEGKHDVLCRSHG
ncbi:hypothetical protein GCM10025770_03810 [Viridibacterium curvum]|uniref:Uncharacterized protein n=1 Tax=Viridibacterium curvum TaxID=1101404 RepID=A0ABP9Q9A3_9RHOO